MAGVSRKVTRRELIWVLIGLTILAVIMGTPFLLRSIAPGGMDWGELSDISQTYGALSVLFSDAALLGVIASLVYQGRQSGLESEEAKRAVHRELLQMAMNDPELIPCWDPLAQPVTATQWKQLVYVNLIFNAWYADYRIGRYGEAMARVILATHFRGELARLHWGRFASDWRQLSAAEDTRRGARFIELADEVYRQAVAAGPAVPVSAYLRQ